MMKRLIVFIVLGLVVMLNAASVRAEVNLNDLNDIPVFHEGRVKPLNSYALGFYYDVAGYASSQEAMEFLSTALFDPAMASQLAVIRVDNHDLVEKIFDEPASSYSLVQLVKALGTPPENLSPREQEDLNALAVKADRIARLIQSFSFLYPVKTDTGTYYIWPDETLDGEKMEAMRAAGAVIDEPALIPPLSIAGSDEYPLWQSPWQRFLSLKQTGDDDIHHHIFSAWRDAAIAFKARDAKAFSAAVATIKQTSVTHSAASVSSYRVTAESLYNSMPVKSAVIAFYGLAFIFMIIRRPFMGRLDRYDRWAVYTPLFIHLLLIVWRMVILARPPVATLYESVIFVALIVGVSGAVMGLRHMRILPVLLGHGGALFLMLMAFLSLSDGDTMDSLVPVLNTNFWLATHVIIITAGYGFCVLCALLAHVNLIKPKWITMKTLMVSAVIALLFTSVGTWLGGIWADQSWGRFWGWDPKENGALLIVLWLAWVLHGRITGLLSQRLISFMLGLLTIIVALAWFGVNLLSVGLHSYGFTEGLAQGLIGFSVLQILILVVLYMKGRGHAHSK